jgi:hypothetical protein
MNRHRRLELVAGDDWQLDATMLDPLGNPIDLSTATVQWTLLDSFGYRAVAPSDYTISLGADPGSATVKVAASHSTHIRGGGYTDFWRVTSNNVTQTLLDGVISVYGDPFTALPEASLTPATGTMHAVEAADGMAFQRSGARSNVVDVSKYRRRAG